MEATHKELAPEFGICREALRQLELTALKKLRVAMELEEYIPRHRYMSVLRALRGKPLSTYRNVLKYAKRGGKL